MHMTMRVPVLMHMPMLMPMLMHMRMHMLMLVPTLMHVPGVGAAAVEEPFLAIVPVACTRARAFSRARAPVHVHARRVHTRDRTTRTG